MKKDIYLLIFGIVLTCIACQSTRKTDQTTSQSSPISSAKNSSENYQPPSIPSMITDQEEAMRFVALHYWDNFSWTDSVNQISVKQLEPIFAHYLGVLLQMPITTATPGIDSLFKGLSDYVYYVQPFFELAEKYLADPNSPYRNEELYITVLQNVLNYSFLSETEKIRPQYQYDLALRNRPGCKATNFTFQYANGNRGSLYQIHAPHLLLLFINPDCNACHLITEHLKNDSYLSQLIAQDRIKVITLYVDEEIDLWRKQILDYPKNWSHAFDPTFTLRDSDLYNLNAIPTIYLLDKEKVVLLKDPTVIQLSHWIRQLHII